MVRVGLNGFGRIGRALFRISEAERQCQIVAINDLDANVENHAYLLRYDSTYGRFDGEVESGPRQMRVNGRRVAFYSVDDVAEVPWARHAVDIVVDATGVLHNVSSSRRLTESQEVRKVIITHAPKEGLDQTIVFGVNEASYDASRHHVVSTSICDVAALAPVLRVLQEHCGVEQGFVTTLHPWLSYQNLIDRPVGSAVNSGWNDFSLGRNSTLSIIPKNTTLVDALCCVLPEVAGRLDAISFRVPTNIVAAADLTVTLQRPLTAERLNAWFRAEARQNSEVVGYHEEPLVSIDFLRTPQSVIVDGRWTRVNHGRTAKVVLWYDNEWGYSHRVLRMIALMSQSMDLGSRAQSA